MKRKAYHKVDKSDERVFLLLLFIIGIGARFIIGNFCKSMENYNDELRYYSLARSLFNGEGMAIRGVVASFQKIGYSVLLMPLFYIANTRHRVTAITLLNSCLMASSVFGAWLIGNELKLKKKARCFIVIAISIWPDLMISSTFMSENLYWPVFLSFVPFWLKSRNSDKRILAVVCGLVSYIGYLTKEIFLAVVMTCIMFEIVYPLIDNIQLGKNREYEGKNKKNKISLKLYDRNNLAFLFYYLMTFFLCHVVLKMTIFKGMGNSYDYGIEAICSVYSFCYLFYAFAYYIIAAIVAYYIFPVIMPAFFFDKLSDNAKRLYLFAVLFIGIASAMIVYANTVREDLGRVAPRLSFRYFGPIFVVVICVFAYLIQEIETCEIIKRKGSLLTFTVFISIAIFAVLKGVTIGSAVDQYVLEVYRKISLLVSNDTLPGLDNTDSITFYTGSIIGNLLIIGWILICMSLLFKDKAKMAVFITISICLVSLINDVLAYRLIHRAYMLDESIVEEAGAINSFFNESDVEKNVLYFTDSNSPNKFSKAMDTYVDKTNLYYVDSKMLMDIPAGESVKVSEIEFKEAIWGSSYEKINTADYIITEADTFTGFTAVSNCEKVSNLPQNHFNVYKNLFPAVIETEPNHDLCLDGDLEVYFTGDLYNANHYVTYGISSMEERFSWTDGDIMHVEIPCEMKEGIAEVRISIVKTFNGEKAYSVSGNGHEITSGAIGGEGMIGFREEIIDGMLSFDLNCKNAEVVNQVVGGDDERKIAFAINNISITRLE